MIRFGGYRQIDAGVGKGENEVGGELANQVCRTGENRRPS